MSKRVRAYIVLDMNVDDLEFDEEPSDEELMRYAQDCFYDDVRSFVKEDDLMDWITTEIIND
jgi:hypothetical protein